MICRLSPSRFAPLPPRTSAGKDIRNLILPADGSEAAIQRFGRIGDRPHPRRAIVTCATSIPPPAEPALAIHQIIAPEVVELLAEPVKPPFAHRRVKPLAPLPQRLGIIEAEAFALLPAQPALPRQRLEPRLVEQHPAGKDIGLDEVGVARIAIEQGVLDADELQRRPPAGLEVAGDGIRDRLATSAAQPPRPSRPRRRRRIAREISR